MKSRLAGLTATLRQVAIVAMGLYVAWTVLVTPAMGETAPWVWIGVMAFLGLCSIPCSRLYCSLTPLLFLSYWAVWAGMLPITTSWAPNSRGVIREVRGMLMAGIISITLVLLSQGRRRSVRAFEWMWLLVFASTLVIAVWEITTTDHLLVTADRSWGGPPRVPAATFINPNNYACVLVVVTALAMQWVSAPRVARWFRAALAAVAVMGIGLIVLTVSRSAQLVVGVQFVLAVLLALARFGHLSRARTWAGRHRLLSVGITSVVAALIAATVFVPALAARNPVLGMLRPSEANVAESDHLRVALTRTGMRYWQQSPWTGTGAGAFESKLNRERPASVSVVTNMHNVFVEILSQYGVVGAAPFALLMLWLLWQALCRVRRRGSPAQPHAVPGVPDQMSAAGAATGSNRLRWAGVVDTVGMRFQLVGLLVAIVAAGLTVSSTLTWAMWWVMIANATVLGWALGKTRSRTRRAGKAIRAATDPNRSDATDDEATGLAAATDCNPTSAASDGGAGMSKRPDPVP